MVQRGAFVLFKCKKNKPATRSHLYKTHLRSYALITGKKTLVAVIQRQINQFKIDERGLIKDVLLLLLPLP